MINCRQALVAGQTLPVVACPAARPMCRGANLRLMQQRLPSLLIQHRPTACGVTKAVAADAAATQQHPAVQVEQGTPERAQLLAAAFRRYSAPLLSVSVAMVCCMLCATHGGGLPFASATAAKQLTSTHTTSVAISSAWAGLAAGCLHTLAGADHLAALTPLTIGVSHLKASLLGALWGFGHSVGQLLLGLCMILLKDRFEALVPAISRFGGTTVGIILVLIGIMGLVEGLHGDDEHHSHGDTSGAASVDGGGVAVAAKDNQRFRFATFATGVVYGLHPDALFVVIPALTLPTKLAAASYILMFVMGTIIAMGSYTAVIGATTKAIEERNAWLASKLSSVASVLAMCVGATILAGEFGIALPFSLSLFGGHAHAH